MNDFESTDVLGPQELALLGAAYDVARKQRPDLPHFTLATRIFAAARTGMKELAALTSVATR